MKKEIPNNYKKRIDLIVKRLPKDDKKDLEDYIRFRRTKAGVEKCRHYLVKIVILRDVAQVPLSKFNEVKLIQKILIRIRNSDREVSERNELRKGLKTFVKWKFNNPEILDLIKLERQSAVNSKKINSATLPTNEEVGLMVRATKNLKDRAMITIQDELALRPVELLNLRWDKIKFFEDHCEIQIDSTKTNQTRLLPLKNSLVHLIRWRNEFPFLDKKSDDYVFPGDDREPHHKQYLAFLYRGLCKRANIKNITPYMIRHKTITEFWIKTNDIKLTALFGGHSVEVCEKVYVNLDKKNIKDIILEKRYDVVEISDTDKNKYDIEIERLKKSIKDIAAQQKQFNETYHKIKAI